VERVGYTFEPFAQNVRAMVCPSTGYNYTLYPSARKQDCFPYYEAAFTFAFTIIPFFTLEQSFLPLPHIPMLYRFPSKKIR